MRRPRPLRVAAGAVLAAVAVGCGSSGPVARPSTSTVPPTSTTYTTTPPTITVNGRSIVAAGIHDVRAALAAAGAVPVDGRLLSAVSGRVLDAHADPAAVVVNGIAATIESRVFPGDAVVEVDGRDRREQTATAGEPVVLAAGARALYDGSTPGAATVTRGVMSGEIVSSTITRAAIPGRLRAPARVALTFDDGPNPPYTDQLLSLLAAHAAPATFCIVGTRAPRGAATIAAEARAGALCDHTEHHFLDLSARPAQEIDAEIRDGAIAIEQAAGAAPTYFRAPGGNWSADIERSARSLHLIPLRWSVDPKDWTSPGTPTIVERVLDQLRPDGVVLLHDGGGDRSQTVAAVSQLLSLLQASGWTFSLPVWVQ